MGLKRTTVYLDEDILFLAHHHGITTGKLSSFFRQCLEGVVLNEEEVDRPDIIHLKARQIAAQMKKELRAQKKIVAQEEAAKTEVLEYQSERQKAIEDACLKIFLKYRDFNRYLPENDVDFEYLEKFDRVVRDASDLAGYDVDPAEVIRIYHEKTRTRSVGSRETDENVFGIKEGMQ